jgi:hypothetical protein
MAGNGGETFLPALAKSFDKINDEQTVNTADFAAACERILPIFDHLGTVFSFARTELAEKKESLVRVKDQLVTLDKVVDADAKAGKLTTKNSCARNLFRLLSGISFISKLLQNMANDRQKPLRQAAAEAYDATLSNMHGYMVRMAIKTSMYMLPNRDHFLASINETEDSAKDHAANFSPNVDRLVKRVLALYEGTSMPMSDARGL